MGSSLSVSVIRLRGIGGCPKKSLRAQSRM
jgi:hypothetical protein